MGKADGVQYVAGDVRHIELLWHPAACQIRVLYAVLRHVFTNGPHCLFHGHATIVPEIVDIEVHLAANHEKLDVHARQLLRHPELPGGVVSRRQYDDDIEVPQTRILEVGLHWEAPAAWRREVPDPRMMGAPEVVGRWLPHRLVYTCTGSAWIAGPEASYGIDEGRLPRARGADDRHVNTTCAQPQGPRPHPKQRARTLARFLITLAQPLLSVLLLLGKLLA
mmetsp:Transcript_90715/g.194565  ORF Transcript_90715/g.194565 Transcript_90715/m.194565 type:complete len:222 (+) Transcript_90715:1603-2268(+)